MMKNKKEKKQIWNTEHWNCNSHSQIHISLIELSEL
jgi:hypothetical protein